MRNDPLSADARACDPGLSIAVGIAFPFLASQGLGSHLVRHAICCGVKSWTWQFQLW